MTRVQAMTDLEHRRPELFAATPDGLPVNVGPAPAKCLPDAEQFWALEGRVTKLEEPRMQLIPKMQQFAIGSAFCGLLAVGVLVSLVAFVVATILLYV